MANFTLTAGADTITGTADDDTVSGTWATFDSWDSLTGGAGTDTLALSGDGAFRVDQLATFTGFENITLLNDHTGNLASLYLGSQSIAVAGYGASSVAVYLGSGAVTFQGGGGGGNRYVVSYSPSSWNAGNAIDGAIISLGSAGRVGDLYDLTTNTLSHINLLTVDGSDLTVQINSAAAGGVANFSGQGTGSQLVTSDAELDLSHSTVSGFVVASTNAAGTNFTVQDLATAFQIAGGVGLDTITAQNFAFTSDQRNAIFATASVEHIVDASGTYTALPFFVMPLSGDLYIQQMGGEAGADSIFGLGTSSADFVPIYSGLPNSPNPTSEVFAGAFSSGTEINFGLQTLSLWAFSNGTDATSIEAFFDKDNYLGMNGSVVEQTSQYTWLLHLDGATSGDNDNNDVLIQLRIAPPNDHAPIITTDPTQTVEENTTFVAALTSTDVDAVGINPATFSITGGTDAALFDIVDGNLVFKAAPDYETDPHSYQVEASAFDGTNTTSELITVNVTNVPGHIINGTNQNDIINATTTVAGQALPSNEEDTIYGGAGKDTINALGGNDFIDGGAGADRMFGGTGNDTYVVDNKSDVANETGGDGSDLVQSSITFSLSDATQAIGAIENLTLTGIAKINGTGNALANEIIGNSGNNILNGLGGADTLTGGQGKDQFVFTALAHSTPSASDLITDFVSGSDILDFSTIDASTSKGGNQAFAFGGQNANVVANSVTWFESSGNTIVQADANGDTTADFQIVLQGTNLNLHVTDFIL
jgi:Ca2+-binding RTX toxin-like protein